MFESTGWILEEPTVSDTSKYDLLVPTIVKENSFESENQAEIGLIQQYQFSSTLQRMSVICRRLGSDYFEIFTKGSPEMIISLSRPETVPNGILDRLKEYTVQGYRVIGMGTKTITNMPFHKIPKLQREDVECDLEFVGLIVLENRLKPQTGAVIETLQNAGMKIVMVTGDNIQTAVSVARECGIIQSGHSVIDIITTKPTKSDVARIRYQESDGAPITGTKVKDVEAMCERKYHFVVSGSAWTDINQYFPEIIPKIVTKGVVFARMSGQQKQQLVEELQNLGYYVAMCGDGANDCGALKAANVGISLSEAESSVASPFTSKEPNISCTTQVIKEGRAALVTSFGVFKLMLCYSLTEFSSVIILYAIDSNLTSLHCYENYAVYSVSMFQYIIMAVVFSKGRPYRKPIYTNYIFLFAIFVMIAICAYVTVDPATWIVDSLELVMPPLYDGRVAILVMAVVNFAVSVIMEEVIVEGVLHKIVRPKFRNVDKSRQKYLRIERDLAQDQSWPNTSSGNVSFGEVSERGPRGVVNNGYSEEVETTKY
ncbi:hypothetical protein GEV33_007075 [Tenebrio molitor]|uniref:Uncharacterized protein n=1 Tax=Tenebrio molitor TaxID=7067 RepID=A0A8J6HJD4_TENMO|nr:hypothetical protein GEV33_007075 [Tenebrio molitor]